MPNKLPPECIERADAAIAYAERVRKMHRRRTKSASSQRQQDIDLALTRIQEAMRPLKSEIGRFPYGPPTEKAERNRQKIRDASAALQRQRRKLWKMNRAARTAEQLEAVQA